MQLSSKPPSTTKQKRLKDKTSVICSFIHEITGETHAGKNNIHLLIRTMKYCFRLCNPGLQPWSLNTEALGSLVGHSDTQGTPSHCRLLFEAHQSTSHPHRPPSGISYAVLLPSQGATHTLVLHLPLGSLTQDTYPGDYM